MTRDFDCEECGHLLGDHIVTGTGDGREGCQKCVCEVVPLREGPPAAEATCHDCTTLGCKNDLAVTLCPLHTSTSTLLEALKGQTEAEEAYAADPNEHTRRAKVKAYDRARSAIASIEAGHAAGRGAR